MLAPYGLIQYSSPFGLHHADTLPFVVLSAVVVLSLAQIEVVLEVLAGAMSVSERKMGRKTEHTGGGRSDIISSKL